MPHLHRTASAVALAKRAGLKKRKPKILTAEKRAKMEAALEAMRPKGKAAVSVKPKKEKPAEGKKAKEELNLRTNQVINELMKTGLSYEEAVARTGAGTRKKALANRAKAKKKEARK